jgi:serine/threonine protein kinase
VKFELQEQLGKYPLLREIGSGATSSVYLARDPFSGRDVAIKVFLFDRDADPQDERMKHKAFVAEAALAGRRAQTHNVEI